MAKTHIMVHHSLTSDGVTVSAAAIERYHTVTNGWADTGYHCLIEEVASPEAYGAAAYQAIIGRPEHEKAAACPQGFMNELALHVCCVGNYDLGPPPKLMLERLVKRVLKPWMVRYGIPPSHIVGHHDYNPAKSCPGLKFSLDELRRMVT